MLPGQELWVQIEKLGHNGEGIIRIDDLVVFVPFALPGEEVVIRIEEVKKKHAFASLVQVVSQSPERIAPLCPAFSRCGGCTAQHLAYAQQKDTKRQGIMDNLRKIAGIKLDVAPVIGMDTPWQYRNKTTWQLGHVGNGPVAGFFAPRSHEIIPVDQCFIASPASNQVKDEVLAFMKAQAPSSLFQLVTRVNKDGDVMVLLGYEGEEPTFLPALAQRLKDQINKVVSVSAFDSQGVKTLLGAPALPEEINGLRFSLSPFSFYQVNHDIMEKMYRYALSQAVQDKNQSLIDIYSGIGTISLLAAQKCKKVTGLELSKSAVLDARNSARQNGLTQVQFVAGYAENELPRLIQQGLLADAVILDPPRKGAHEAVLRAIIKAAPQTIVYISCHPATQMRDAAILDKNGYEAVACQPFDMFPQTAEIENVMTFKRRTI